MDEEQRIEVTVQPASPHQRTWLQRWWWRVAVVTYRDDVRRAETRKFITGGYAMTESRAWIAAKLIVAAIDDDARREAEAAARSVTRAYPLRSGRRDVGAT